MIWRKHIHIVVLRFLVKLEIGNVGFWGEGKTEVPREKPLGARERTNNKLNPCMASTLGIGPGPHWWEGIALITTPPLLPSHIIIQLLKCKIPERVLLTKAICKRFSKVCGLSPLAKFTKRNEVKNILSIPSVVTVKRINRILICMFLNISTNQRRRVRSWPCHLH